MSDAVLTDAIDESTGPPWQRLDRRMVGAALVRMTITLVPVAVAWLFLGQQDWASGITFAVIGALTILVPASYVIRYVKFRYRLTDTELQITTGLLFRSSRRVPLHRIRTVDIVAKPVLRLFGLAIVTVGTGEQVVSGGSALVLDAVSRHTATALRDTLLAAAREKSAPTDEATDPVAPAPPDEPGSLRSAGAPDDEVLRLRWRWSVYHLVGLWSLVAPTAFFGVVYQMMSLLGQRPDTYVGWYLRNFVTQVPVTVWLASSLALFLAIGVVGSALIFGEAWWGYRLRREAHGRYVATRGLLTTRSFTADQSRLRGVTLSAAALTRALGGLRLTPIMTGISLQQQSRESGLLAPTTTVAEARGLAAELMGRTVIDGHGIPGGAWERHPRRARNRIMTRYLGADAAVAALLVLAAHFWAWTWWLLAAPLAVSPLLIAAAFAYYRRLGHSIQGDLLYARRGFFLQRTDIVELRGISGATIGQTVFQRRLGLASVTATTAAGERAYSIVDVHIDTAVTLAGILSGDTCADADRSEHHTLHSPSRRES